jgi:deoxyinosine 3'endonuclease (endonuclease V)
MESVRHFLSFLYNVLIVSYALGHEKVMGNPIPGPNSVPRFFFDFVADLILLLLPSCDHSKQLTLKEQILIKNDVDWTVEVGKPNTIKYIGGVDISFVKDNNVDACAALIICSYPDYNVVYESFKHVQLTLPYIPGFLAFREVPFLVELLDDLRAKQPELMPQCIIVDGNGILHVRGFGLACHLGVLTGIPAFGCAKTLFMIDGLDMKIVKNEFKEKTKEPGDYTELIGKSGVCHGIAYKSTNETTNPVFLSPGHRVDAELMIAIANTCCQARIPEPVRQADLRSRAWIRRNFKN